MSNSVLVVIPCRDEEATIARTLDSLLGQAVAPAAIVVVDDGSIDATPEILARYSDSSPRVTTLRIDREGGRESGGGIAQAVSLGLSKQALSDYAFIAKFDADLEFPPHYIEACLAAFAADAKLGLVGGQCTIQREGEWVLEKMADLDHVRGALKLYRGEAFETMGGIQHCIGWDTIDEHALRFHGWKVAVLPELHVRQYRPTNTATDPHRMAEKIGRSLYNMRASPAVLAVSLLKRASVMGGDMPIGALLKGYTEAWRHREISPPPISRQLGNFINEYRSERYRQKIHKMLKR